MTEAPRIQSDGVTVEYPLTRGLFKRGPRHHRALNNISFEIESGERVGLIGRNGCGKSTLLRVLAGVVPPSEGSLTVTGSVAAIFNVSLGFIQEATGYENILLRGTLLGLTMDDIRARAPEITAFAELEDWIHQPVHRYSSGMTLRLAFAITTTVKRDILLLDEWLGAGDARFLDKAKARMDEMLGGSSILLLATHNINLMRQYCERAILIENGVIEFAGPVDETADAFARLKRERLG